MTKQAAPTSETLPKFRLSFACVPYDFREFLDVGKSYPQIKLLTGRLIRSPGMCQVQLRPPRIGCAHLAPATSLPSSTVVLPLYPLYPARGDHHPSIPLHRNDLSVRQYPIC